MNASFVISERFGCSILRCRGTADACLSYASAEPPLSDRCRFSLITRNNRALVVFQEFSSHEYNSKRVRVQSSAMVCHAQYACSIIGIIGVPSRGLSGRSPSRCACALQAVLCFQQIIIIFQGCAPATLRSFHAFLSPASLSVSAAPPRFSIAMPRRRYPSAPTSDRESFTSRFLLRSDAAEIIASHAHRTSPLKFLAVLYGAIMHSVTFLA